MENMLDKEVSDILLPINMASVDMSFYNALSKCITGFSEGGHAIRLAVIQKVVSEPDAKCVDASLNFFRNLNMPAHPIQAVISLCSDVTSTNVVLFNFDEATLKTISRSTNSYKRDVYIGVANTSLGIYCFPMVLKSDAQFKRVNFQLKHLFHKYEDTNNTSSISNAFEDNTGPRTTALHRKMCTTECPKTDKICYSDSEGSDLIGKIVP